MARLARVVVPGIPHHVTQRGNRRQPTFFNDGDYAAYLELIADGCRDEGGEIWGYCLMPTMFIGLPCRIPSSNFGTCKNTAAPAGRSGARRSWSVWRRSSVAS